MVHSLCCYGLSTTCARASVHGTGTLRAQVKPSHNNCMMYNALVSSVMFACCHSTRRDEDTYDRNLLMPVVEMGFVFYFVFS